MNACNQLQWEPDLGDPMTDDDQAMSDFQAYLFETRDEFQRQPHGAGWTFHPYEWRLWLRAWRAGRRLTNSAGPGYNRPWTTETTPW